MADMYMRNIRDWREATLMLSMEEKGYFDEILSLIYLHDDFLPDDDRYIARSIPIHIRLQKRLKQKLIDVGLIEIKNGFYFNKRASLEIKKINKLSKKNQIKAANRWAKLLKNNKTADAAALLKVNREGESEEFFKTLIEEDEKELKRNVQSNGTRSEIRITKCTINSVLDPDGEIPEEYRHFAESQGLRDPQRRFNDWAGWWVGENGLKAGPEGWLQTWKARVRKDVDRQVAGNSDRQKQGRDPQCAITEGARLALNRRRNRGREI